MRRLGTTVARCGIAAIGMAVASVVAMGCGEAPAPPPQRAELEGGLVARVGDIAISQDTVKRIAGVQALSPSDALNVAIGDALFEAEMRQRGVLDPASMSFDRSLQRRARAELSRAMLVRFGEQVAGPVTDEELKRLTEKHWMQVQRPKAWRVAHALVMSKDPTPEQREAAEARAKAIVRAIAPIVEKTRDTPAPKRQAGARVEDMRSVELRKAVEALSSSNSEPKLQTRVEELPPIVEEGWGLTPRRGSFEPDFVKAAVALKARGDLSPLTWSSYGVHVIVLLEILPGNMLEDDARRKLFLPEATAQRAQGAHATALEGLRSQTEVSVIDGVDTLLRGLGEGS